MKEKISNFCHVGPDQVICIHDLSSIYHVPILMESSGVMKFLTERLHLNISPGRPDKPLSRWRYIKPSTRGPRSVKISHTKIQIF